MAAPTSICFGSRCKAISVPRKWTLPPASCSPSILPGTWAITAASPPPWLYIVHTDIPADVVDDYNAWYDQEHLPRLVTVPGVDRARRYVATGDLRPRFLTAYDLSIKDAFESPQGLVARKTPWTERMRSLFQNTRRKMCALQT